MMKQVFTSAGYLALASAIEKFGAILLIPILTNKLSKDDFGELILVYSYMSILSLFYYNGLNSALFRWVSMREAGIDLKLYEKTLFCIINGAGLLILFIMLLISILGFNLFELLKVDRWLFVAAYFATLAMVGYNLKSAVWIIENKAYANLVFSIGRTIICIPLVLLLFHFGCGAASRPIAEVTAALGMSVTIISGYWLYYPSLKKAFNGNLILELKDSFKYGWGIQISQLAFWVINSCDRVMIANVAGKESVALYSITMIGTSLLFIVVAFGNSFTVLYNKDTSQGVDHDSVNKKILKLMVIGFGSSIIYKLLLFIFSQQIVRLLSNTGYIDAGKYLFLTSDILLMYFIYILSTRYFHVKKQVAIVMVTMFIAALLNIALNIPLIKMFDYVGALISSALSYAIMALCAGIFLHKHQGTKESMRILILTFCIIVSTGIIDLILNAFRNV